MNINAYNLRDIQTILALLNQADSAGIRDVRILRDVVQRRAAEQRRQFGHRRIAVSRTKQAADYGNCPDCNTPLLPVNTGGDQLKIVGCHKCRYSRVIS